MYVRLKFMATEKLIWHSEEEHVGPITRPDVEFDRMVDKGIALFNKAETFLGDALTVPNAVSLLRLLSAPGGYRDMRDQPGKKWKKIAGITATDLEGNLARLNRLPRIGEFLGKIGFRTSETGAQLDPVADFSYGMSVLAGGVKGGTIPRHAGSAVFMQRSLKAGITLGAKAEGQTLRVSNIGAAGELVGVCGNIAYAASEAQSTPIKRYAVRGLAYALMATGFVMSSASTLQYGQDAHLFDLPETIDTALSIADAKVGQLLPGGSRQR